MTTMMDAKRIVFEHVSNALASTPTNLPVVNALLAVLTSFDKATNKSRVAKSAKKVSKSKPKVSDKKTRDFINALKKNFYQKTAAAKKIILGGEKVTKSKKKAAAH